MLSYVCIQPLQERVFPPVIFVGFYNSLGRIMLEFRPQIGVVLLQSRIRCKDSSLTTCFRELHPARMSSHRVRPWIHHLYPKSEKLHPHFSACLWLYLWNLNIFICGFVCSGWRIRGSCDSGANEDPVHGQQIQTATHGGGRGRKTRTSDWLYVFHVMTCTGRTGCLSLFCSVPVRHQRWWWSIGPSTKRSAATWRKTSAWYSWIQVKTKI